MRACKPTSPPSFRDLAFHHRTGHVAYRGRSSAPPPLVHAALRALVANAGSQPAGPFTTAVWGPYFQPRPGAVKAVAHECRRFLKSLHCPLVVELRAGLVTLGPKPDRPDSGSVSAA